MASLKRQAGVLMLVLLGICQSSFAQLLWYDEVGPNFLPSVPSSANGDVYYRYQFFGDSTPNTWEGLSCLRPAIDLDGVTTEYGTIGSSLVACRGYREQKDWEISDPGVCGGSSTTNYMHWEHNCMTDPPTETEGWQEHGNMWGLFSADYNETSGTGWTLRTWVQTNALNYSVSSGACSPCGAGVWGFGWSVFYKVELWLDQGYAPPTLPAIPAPASGSAKKVPGVKVEYWWDGYDCVNGTTLSAGFKVSRTGSTASALTVNFGLSGTATYNVDYTTSTPSSVTIPANQSAVFVEIYPVLDCDSPDPEETVRLTLNPSTNYVIIGSGWAEVPIKDY